MTEVRTTSATGGQKGVKDQRFDLIPIDALTQLATHYGQGAKKYDDNQWRKGYEWSKSYAALMRHLTAFWEGEDFDEETGSNHMACVAWHAFTLLTFYKEFPEFDDRYTPEEVGSANTRHDEPKTDGRMGHITINVLRDAPAAEVKPAITPYPEASFQNYELIPPLPYPSHFGKNFTLEYGWQKVGDVYTPVRNLPESFGDE